MTPDGRPWRHFDTDREARLLERGLRPVALTPTQMALIRRLRESTSEFAALCRANGQGHYLQQDVEMADLVRLYVHQEEEEFTEEDLMMKSVAAMTLQAKKGCSENEKLCKGILMRLAAAEDRIPGAHRGTDSGPAGTLDAPAEPGI